jgi:hypothetical protein
VTAGVGNRGRWDLGCKINHLKFAALARAKELNDSIALSMIEDDRELASGVVVDLPRNCFKWLNINDNVFILGDVEAVSGSGFPCSCVGITQYHCGQFRVGLTHDNSPYSFGPVHRVR